jgi:hypothetical protein
MLDQAQELPCIPSVTQGLRSFFCRQNHPADEAPENCFGRNRHADTTKRERRATIPSKLRGGRRPVSPSSIQKLRTVSFPCVLPRLSFGEALPDADQLFTSVSGSSDQIPLSPCQDDQSAQTRGRQRTQADEHREECVCRHPMEYPYVDTNPPSSYFQPPPRQTRPTPLLETCIIEMMATPERRGGGARSMRVFDGGITQPIPLITEGSRSRGGYSLFPSLRQRAGNASTPPALIPHPGPEHSEAKARLDSAAIPASETHQAEHTKAKAHLDNTDLPASENHQTDHPKAKARIGSADIPASENHTVSTLDPLEEDINRDSAAYIPGKPTPVTNTSGPSNAKAVPVDRSKSHDTSATEDVSPSVLDQPAIVSPPSLRFRSQPASQSASQNSPPPNSLRTSRNLKCRPVNRPQNSQTSSIVAAANPSPSRGDGSPVVDGPSSSSGMVATSSSPSPPPVSPCDLGGEEK